MMEYDGIRLLPGWYNDDHDYNDNNNNRINDDNNNEVDTSIEDDDDNGHYKNLGSHGRRT